MAASKSKAKPQSKSKKKKKSKITGLATILLAIAAVVAGSHFSGIFTFDDWKEFFGEGLFSSGSEATVHFIDVGQGDCELVISDGKSLLIDTGEKENAEDVCEYIKSQGIETINYMILTHPHSDHMGGASEIIKSMDVENIIIPRIPDDVTPTTKFYEKFLTAVQEKGLKLTPAEPGKTYQIGACTLEILSPVKDYDDNYNNYSAAALLTNGDDTFLFTGDIEKKAEKDIIETGRLRDVDVLKVAHHGSSTSSCKSFLDTVTPDYAVICCKSGNSYNHPHKDTVERLGKYTDKIYRTDLNGTIVFTSTGSGVTVKMEKGD